MVKNLKCVKNITRLVTLEDEASVPDCNSKKEIFFPINEVARFSEEV